MTRNGDNLGRLRAPNKPQLGSHFGPKLDPTLVQKSIPVLRQSRSWFCPKADPTFAPKSIPFSYLLELRPGHLLGGIPAYQSLKNDQGERRIEEQRQAATPFATKWRPIIAGRLNTSLPQQLRFASLFYVEEKVNRKTSWKK